METDCTDISTRLFSTHNFRLLLRHFFFGNDLLLTLLFLLSLWEMTVSQELLDEFRAVQIVLRFPCVFCTVVIYTLHQVGGESASHYHMCKSDVTLTQ